MHSVLDAVRNYTCAVPAEMVANFYAKRAADEGWTRAVLQAMITSQLYERSQPALTTFDRPVPDADREAVRELVKARFILDFLAAEPARERDLSKPTNQCSSGSASCAAQQEF